MGKNVSEWLNTWRTAEIELGKCLERADTFRTNLDEVTNMFKVIFKDTKKRNKKGESLWILYDPKKDTGYSTIVNPKKVVVTGNGLGLRWEYANKSNAIDSFSELEQLKCNSDLIAKRLADIGLNKDSVNFKDFMDMLPEEVSGEGIVQKLDVDIANGRKIVGVSCSKSYDNVDINFSVRKQVKPKEYKIYNWLAKTKATTLEENKIDEYIRLCEMNSQTLLKIEGELDDIEDADIIYDAKVLQKVNGDWKILAESRGEMTTVEIEKILNPEVMEVMEAMEPFMPKIVTDAQESTDKFCKKMAVLKSGVQKRFEKELLVEAL